MPKPGLSTEHEPGAEMAAEHDADQEHDGLKAILDAIGAQLSDADQRYAATLTEMQHRIADMEREAEALRHLVPGQLSPAFERIEAGVSELAHRFADAGSGPLPLRSAKDAHDSGPHARDGIPPKNAEIDTFDVIEPHGSEGAAYWDHASAETLADFYESGAADFGSTGCAEAMSSAPAVDQTWLEARFAEVAKGIERALADIHPVQTINAVSQRFDRFEHQIASKLDGVAKRSDLASIDRIEEQVRDVIHHLVASQDQLARLSVVEEQLALLSKQLEELKLAGARSSEQSVAANVPSPAHDIDAVANAAAERTAQLLAEIQSRHQSSAADELRPLMERILAENRHGEENTTALLDTLQQAMIRLLDRVESIEFGQNSSTQAQLPVETKSESSFASEPEHDAYPDDDGAHWAKSEIEPIVPKDHLQPMSQPSDLTDGDALNSGQYADDTANKSEQLRQDFIAQARRAKMRLEENEDVADAPLSAISISSHASETQSATDLRGSRPIRHTVTAVKPIGPSLPSPRLVIIAVAAIAALSALWYALGTGGDQPVTAQPAAVSPMSQALPQEPAQANAPTSPANTEPQPGSEQPNSTVTPSDGTGRRSDAGSASGTEGQIVAGDAPRGTTTVPMLGVAVDTERPVTGADLQLAKRHQAMATMSGKIGEAVANSGTSPVVPASMVPSEAETSALTSPTRRGPIDIPAASVGPLSLRLAAANGDPSAEFEVGARFAEGKGTTQSFNEAAKWYQLSADQGFAQAQYRLGTLYERGLGLKSDRSLAATWYQRAADQGNVKAMHNLAVLSSNQTDQSPDYATAAKWFEEAAKRGLTDSQFNLAVLYENGLGVKRDMVQAFMWQSLAARNGDGDAVRRRDILRGKLTAVDIAAAEQMIAEWKPLPADRTVNDARAAGEAWKRNPKNGVSG